MKTSLIVLLTLATAGLTTLCVLQSRKVVEQKKQMATQAAVAEERARAMAAIEQERQQNEQHQREMLRQSDQLVAQARAQQVAVSNQLTARLTRVAANNGTETAEQGSGTSAGFGSMFSKMMSDPETKKLIAETQRTMMRQLYSPLVKQLGLTPEEADKFNGLLADNASKTTEQASSMFAGAGSSNQTDIASSMAEQQKSFQQEMKSLLGDARYAQFQDYQLTVGDRAQLNMYKQQGFGDGPPLSDQQTEQLLALMKDARQTMVASGGETFSGAGQNGANVQAMLADGKLETMLDNQTIMNQNVYTRAKDILSPDQLAAFGTFQTNQLQMMRVGMTMARKMLAPANATQPAPGP